MNTNNAFQALPAFANQIDRDSDMVMIYCGRRGTLEVGGQSMAGGRARRRTGGPNRPSKARGP
jgi:hypothetical protein